VAYDDPERGVPRAWNEPGMTGPELKQLRADLGEAIGRELTAADMAKLCGLAASGGADTIRRWEVAGPSGPAAELLRILAMASERHPILQNFSACSTAMTSASRTARRAGPNSAKRCAPRCAAGWLKAKTSAPFGAA